MADLKQIQFKRTTTAGKKPTTSNIAEGELALNMADSALYTRSGDAIIQLTGKNIPEIDTNKLTVAGTTTLKDNVTISPNKAISFETTDLSGEITRHIVGKCATNDGWYIGAGGTSNNGILEIGTIDDGTETIQFVQRGAGNVEARKLVLLDSSGNTTLPGDLRLSTNKAIKIYSGSTSVLEMGVGANDVYIKNQKGAGVLQLTNDSNLTFRNSQVYYAMNGRGPGKSGTLLTNVENNRQAWQYTISAASAATPRWVKVATIKHPGMGSSQLDLMISGGIDSGHGRHYVDFITLSGRNLTSWSTNSLDNWVEWRRVGSPSKTNVPEYYVVKNDSATDADASFDFYAKIPRYGNGLYVTVLNTSGYNGQYSGTVIIYETGQDTGDTGPSGSILVSMKQIFDSIAKPDFSDTTGTLPVNRGGTGATNVGDARNNLGLRTAAVRDVGESSGNVMEVGAFGIGGHGKSLVDITSDVDLMTRLKALGGTTFRANVASGYTGAPYYPHGAGFFSRTGDTMSALNIDYLTGNVRVFAINDSGLASGRVNANVLYGTANKPSKADVGLGNLTNDTQVKKAGDTMTGDLTAPNFHASGPGTASVYVNAGTGNAHVWFRTDANERGVIWATPNTADLGQINIRAKTTGGTSAGDFSFRSDGRLDVPVAVKVGGAAMLTKDGNITSGSMFGGNLNNYLTSIKNDITTGDSKQVSKTGDTMTGNLTINANLKVENPNGTMVDLGSENSDKYSRLTLARKVGDGAAVAMLKVAPEGYVQFGYQSSVTAPSPTKYIRVKPDGLDVEGDLIFNQTYRGTEEAIDISDKTIDLNNMVIKKADPGTRQLYKCVSSGGGSKISNKPTSDGNFVLEVLSLRKVSDTDWSCKQTFTTKNGNVEGTYVRYCQNGTWSAWKEVVAGVQPINLGGTGATSVAAARNNLGVGEGQTVSFGNLVTNDLTANGNVRLVGRLNLGSASATAVLRANEAGAVVLGSASGANIHIRAGSADTSAGETRFEPNGNVTVGGALTSSGSLQVNGEAAMSRSLIVSQNIKNTNDNSFILMGKDSDLGFVKKSGAGSKLVFASGKSFTVAKSSATTIANPATETYTDVFKIDADGNQTVYGNAQVNRQLTVSSSATVAGVINANGGIIVPTTKYVQIADAPTQNNQATNKQYVDDRINTRLATAGGTVTGDLNVNGTVGLKGQVVLSKDLTVNNGKISAQAIELSMGTPYIDFHFNNSSSDYTTRLIENTSGELTLEGAFMCKKHMYAWGAVMARNVAPTNPPNGTLITGAPLQSMTEGRGGNGDARGLVANFYSEELVGTSHRAVIYLDGHKRTDAWIFNAGGVIDTPTGAVQTAGSDIRLKSNITPAKDGALERIMKLGTVEFDMKGETRRRRGFIAQQVDKVDASYTFQGNEQTIDGEKIKILNIDQTAIVADLVSTVQEQQKLILELQKQINTLK